MPWITMRPTLPTPPPALELGPIGHSPHAPTPPMVVAAADQITPTLTELALKGKDHRAIAAAYHEFANDLPFAEAGEAGEAGEELRELDTAQRRQLTEEVQRKLKLSSKKLGTQATRSILFAGANGVVSLSMFTKILLRLNDPLNTKSFEAFEAKECNGAHYQAPVLSPFDVVAILPEPLATGLTAYTAVTTAHAAYHSKIASYTLAQASETLGRPSESA